MLCLSPSFVALLALVPLVTAQGASPAWGQCGGETWNGATTCVSGYTCTATNQWYSQCVPGTAPGPSTAAPPPPTGTSVPQPTVSGLHALAKSKGLLYFGSATDNGELSDAAYKAKLADDKEFGQITPGNSQKWEATEPSRGTFTFANGDAIVNLAKANGQLVRGHTLVWHSQLPGWVSSGGFNAATLTSIIQTHVTALVSHWKGQLYAWDLTNELFEDDGTWRVSVFSTILGTTFPHIAVKAARAGSYHISHNDTDPNVKLYLNDYNIDGLGAKSTAMVNLVKSLAASGNPIDGVGIQAHLIVGSIPSTFQQNIQQFVNLGVEVAITELDIRMTLPVTAAKLEQQRKDYQFVIAACRAVKGCVGITIWDWTDKFSWVPSVFKGEGAALPWDESFNKKPAYSGIVAGLQ